MPNPEADYTIEFSDEEKAILQELQDHPMPKPPQPAPVPANQSPETDRGLAAVQAASASAEIEGEIATGDHVELLGRKFRVAEKIGFMPFLKYSAVMERGPEDPRSMASIYTLLRDCIYPGTPACGKCETCKAGNDLQCAQYDPGDWADFEEHAMMTRADAKDLLDVITSVMEIISGRPTALPGGSSAGRRPTRAGSTGSYSGRRGKGSRR